MIARRKPKLPAALALATAAIALFGASARADDSGGSFNAYEIRVIRPKYMAKRGRVELGAEGTLIMNQSFIYTLMLSGMLDYHFSEMFAFEAGGSYGFSVDKDDKRILDSDFDIKTQIRRTQYIANGGLLWTPIYGKTQLTSGRVVYFDSFLTLQGGMTGVNYTYEQCVTPPANVTTDVTTPPSPAVKSYPTGVIGFGQKYFLSQNSGLRWDLRDYIFQYEKGDGTCTPNVAIGPDIHQNITLQLGASTFF